MNTLGNLFCIKPIETDYQPESNLSRVLLTINCGDQSYAIGILGINHSPAELFYHSSWPKDANRNLIDSATGKQTKRPDHLSCHSDGITHMRTSKKGILGTPWQFPDRSFLPKDSSSVSPILIHSIKAKESNYDLPLVSDISTNSYQIIQQVATIKTPQNFSISLFLVPTNISSNDILSGMWIDFHSNSQSSLRLDFRNLCNRDFRPGRLKVQDWSGWDVLVVPSDMIMPIPSDIGPEDFFKIITIVNTLKCFEKMLVQRIGRVEFMKKSDQDF